MLFLKTSLVYAGNICSQKYTEKLLDRNHRLKRGDVKYIVGMVSIYIFFFSLQFLYERYLFNIIKQSNPKKYCEGNNNFEVKMDIVRAIASFACSVSIEKIGLRLLLHSLAFGSSLKTNGAIFIVPLGVLMRLMPQGGFC